MFRFIGCCQRGESTTVFGSPPHSPFAQAREASATELGEVRPELMQQRPLLAASDRRSTAAANGALGSAWTWLLALAYAALAVVVAAMSYQNRGGDGALGQRAFAELQELVGDGAVRGWATREAWDAAKKLKSEISSLELQFLGLIEARHQHVPLTEENILGPWRAPECQDITVESCARLWGHMKMHSLTCAVTCPFDINASDGPRCCGELPKEGDRRPPLPVFSWFNDLENDRVSLRKSGGQVTLTNVVFRLKGTGAATDGSAIMVSAHYDSADDARFPFDPDQSTKLPTNHGPGVSDDLAGVAVLLEVAKKLAAGPRLSRDVIFAFVSGEEAGLMGSVVFRQFHEWRNRPGVVINLEGKGKANSKEWLVRANSAYGAGAYARFASRPAGFSFSEWIFRALPVGVTDLDIYRRLGYHCMDLVWVHDSYVYHTPDDDINSASPAGLQHEGSNLLSIIRGVAQDSEFPQPIAPEDDPVVGLWNNEFYSDPGMDSRSVYVALFDKYMWLLPVRGARVLFVTCAVVAPLASIVFVVYIKLAFSEPGQPAMKRVLGASAADALVGLGSVLLGALVAVAMDQALVNRRDARTWYDSQGARFAFLGISGVLPALALELCRRGVPGFFGTGDGPGDHPALLGSLAVYSLLLVLATPSLPDLGFALFWFVAFAPLGLASEILMRKIFAAAARRGTGAHGESLNMLPLSPRPQVGSDAFVSADPPPLTFRAALAVFAVRDVFAVGLPTLLQVPQVFNLVSVLSYILDSMDMGIGNGALCGIVSSLAVLVFLPVLRRVSLRVLSFNLVLTTMAWLAAVLQCVMAPTNVKLYCYFDSTC